MQYNRSYRTNVSSSLPPRVSLFEELKALSGIERVGLLTLMLVVFVFITLDVVNDIQANASSLHITSDIAFGILALVGMFLLWARLGRKHIDNSLELAKVIREKGEVSAQSAHWQMKAEQLKNGISQEIDFRMDQWKLSLAEKEVGLLLLKGFSIKEIAALRGTSEGTVRHQSLAIYSKSGVTGRSELSAYFIEDLLDRKVEEPRFLSKGIIGGDSREKEI